MGEQVGTILNVDDNEASRYASSRLLRKAGFAVREAASGAEALARAGERPDLIVLDVNLPDLNGFEVCRRIRASPATASIPVLYLSAHFTRDDEISRGLTEGGDGYLTQPVDPVELVATVSTLLRLRRAESQMQALARRWQASFDAIGDGVCLLDPQGGILQCNAAFGRLVGERTDGLAGRSWPELRRGLLGGLQATGPFERLRFSRQREADEWDLGDRRLRATVDPMFEEGGELAGAVLILADVTDRARAERAEAQAQGQAVRIEQLEEELRNLAALAGVPRAGVTATLFGVTSLRESSPATFQELVAECGTLLDLSLEQREYKIDHGMPDRIRALSDRLGFLRAGPRDVIELYGAALASRRQQARPLQFQAYAAEGRLLVLELMGNLLAYYRLRSLGARDTPRRDHSGR